MTSVSFSLIGLVALSDREPELETLMCRSAHENPFCSFIQSSTDRAFAFALGGVTSFVEHLVLVLRNRFRSDEEQGLALEYKLFMSTKIK